ncbi:(2Fe-2S)-binding protein [Paenibacillus profundus]|uniref:(2Fe-2S)-binding protein n=1 Tax=Paenibacillus profundus TaxID=1173085 RepID=A0ABS8YGT9_9BACL|nr:MULTISPECIES: 2Fe-2S iron-sulfur cluster-binding protein [Paenibacillus]MCE5169575.1 (2Fe-2S)-binding protein [Paenibacillus profundus]
MADITLTARTGEATVTVPLGTTLLDAAVQADVGWNYACTRGTCARCRCVVEEGREHLSEVTDAEWDRMEEEEFAEGYRLACQAVIETDGVIRAAHKPYF